MTTLLVAIAVLAIACGWFIVNKVRNAREFANLETMYFDKMTRLEEAHARLRDVEPREARFRKALGYYADEETYAAPAPGKHSPVFKDRGKIAREALQ